ncbi:MAG: DEAD/DEAH box helicase, partial [Chloroflexi bacterium]|nr:DEAD/DEAH box helicase [Chloroflexota bacterium]
MSRVYVAVDLETTGLDPERDAIIELGAVRFRDGEILDLYSQVVNPGRAVPRAIQQLTGITQAEIARAPRLADIASSFRAFIGDAPLVGHNIGFDISFLRSHNLYRFNPGIDTWTLSLILLPGLSSYKLGRIAEHLGIELREAHRALDDAAAAMEVFQALYEKGAALPRRVLQTINRIAESSDWPLRDLFREFEQEAARRWGRGARAEKRKPVEPLFDRFQPLEPIKNPQPLDVDELVAMLEPGGRFAEHFPHYEHRPPQVEMLRTVAEAFNQSRHVMIEAGTGTGKSVAYLIPALAWAVQTGRRVMVSSNTINLQDQLFNKDLPDLKEILPFDFEVAVLKGRSNYLCPRRLKNLLQRGDLNRTEIDVLARVLVWLQHTETGEQSEIVLLNARERAVWQRICSDPHTCSPTFCLEQGGRPCYFYQARRRAEAAHLVIINHALLFADVKVDNKALPPYEHLIIDEAHHLEDAATNALAVTVDHPGFAAHLRDLTPLGGGGEKAGGLLSAIVTAVKNACPSDRAEAIAEISRRLVDAAPSLDLRMHECMDAMERFLQEREARRKDGTRYDIRLRITRDVRAQPAWVDVEIMWENLDIVFKDFLEDLARLLGGLQDLSNYSIANGEALIADLQSILEALLETRQVLKEAVDKPDANTIYWLRRSQQNGIVILHSAPLHVGNLIEREVFLPRDTVILTSATLRTANSFAYLRERIGANDVDEVALDSPFDYRSAALLYLPTDMPEPNRPEYQPRVEEAILRLSLATEGRLLALFTSYAQMKRTAEALLPALLEAGLTLHVQGQGGSRQQILDEFKQGERAVLLGTRSFWEGVDVQGDALSALVIARLPFAVPTDPIIAARSETFDSPFYQYSIPMAILNLRQGFGRLIRSAQDRGVCVILDRR